MCGIVGKITYDGTPIEPGLIKKMCATLAHRGPDDEGVWISHKDPGDGKNFTSNRLQVGLGHRRLSIIDLTEAGHQPMPNEDRSLWISYNGEIYNFLELRSQLESKGHLFSSATDTEVILHLYEEYGDRCVNHLRGMFAFAIWDKKQQRLLLARDRLGKKPLFYYADSKKFLFASEIKAILADPEINVSPDLTALHHYLTYQYIPSPFSAFKGIKKLPPGHILTLENGVIRISRYWKLSYSYKQDRKEEEWLEIIIEKLKEAVGLRMVSDVPLGAFLSGGIDSSAVVALMAQLSPTPIKTFSIGFEEKEYNELAYARLVAQRYQTEHHEFIVRPNAIEILPKLIWHYNEPFADSSAIPTYYLAKMTREYVTVALNGDAGDENFAGYDRYVANKLATWYDYLPGILWSKISKLTDILPYSTDPRSFLRRVKRFLEALAEPRERRYGRWVIHFSNYMKEGLYTQEFKELVAGIDSMTLLEHWYASSDAPDFIDATLSVDVNSYLPDDLLVKVDIASMAHSLEARSPFLDHEFMELVAQIPSSLKLKGRNKKYILKKALASLIPAEILNRPKMGFGVPIDHWFRKELKEMAYDILLDNRSLQRGYFNRNYIKQMLDEHSQSYRNWHFLLWNLLILELWHRMFIDGKW
jgi:asparagine synthase (glutamine-hydrolysing)